MFATARCSDYAAQKFRGCFRYLENDAPYLCRMEGTSTTREKQGGRTEDRELSGKKRVGARYRQRYLCRGLRERSEAEATETGRVGR